MIRKISQHILLIVLFFSLSAASRAIEQAPKPTYRPEPSWTLLDGPTAPGGIVDDLVDVPQFSDELYALFQGRNGERLFRSTDASLSWQQVYTFTVQVNHLSVSPTISNTLFAGGPDGTFRSYDNGISWTQVYTLGEALAVAADDIVFAAGKISSNDGCNTYAIAQSHNHGEDWQVSHLECIGGITQLVIDPTNSETIYAAGYITETTRESPAAYPAPTPYPAVRIWRSLDGGQTFTTLPVEGIYHYVKPASLIVDPQAPQRLYLSTYGVMISNDYGESWQTNTDIPREPFILMKNGYDLYAMQTNTGGFNASVYRSQDQGYTWWEAARKLPSQVNTIAANPAQSDRVYVGTGGFGIFRSNTRGGDWQEQNIGIQTPASISSLAVAQSDPDTIYAGSFEPRGGVFGSHDGGLTWQYILTDTKVFCVAVSPSNAGLVFAGASNGLLQSENEESWTWIYSGDYVFSITLPDTGSEGLYIAGNRTYGLGTYTAHFLGLSIEGALVWGISTSIGDAFQIQKVLLDTDQSGRVYVGALTYYHGGAIYKQENGQDTWQTVLENADGEVIDLLFDPRNSDTMYAGTYAGVYVSPDRGQTWDLRNSGFPAGSAANQLALDELGTLFTGTYYTGVYRWDSVQARWIQDGLAGQPVNALAFAPGGPPVLLAGNKAGLWMRELPNAQNIWLPLIINPAI